VVLNHGHVQQIAAPLELYDHPANRFVAGFIGSPAMNFFEGTVGRDDGAEFRAAGDAFRLPLSAEWAERLRPYAGRAVVLGIRPESVFAQRGRPADAALAEVPFTVQGVEPLGNEVFLHAAAGPHRVTARVAPQPVPGPGEPLALAFDLGRLHFFDPADERSLAPEIQEAA
ncbi:MAG TPA: TOBE domain-containing protein, partial [Longimicrobiaceae bacterium]|nr:TOBE domain-containing protein [Longimicrobiaceae bacterium]